MYAAIWRALPGPRSFKVTDALVLVVAVVAVPFVWMFPVVAEEFGIFDSTVG